MSLTYCYFFFSNINNLNVTSDPKYHSKPVDKCDESVSDSDNDDDNNIEPSESNHISKTSNY